MASRDLVPITHQSGSQSATQIALGLVAGDCRNPGELWRTSEWPRSEWQKGRIAAALRQPKFVRDENTTMAEVSLQPSTRLRIP